MNGINRVWQFSTLWTEPLEYIIILYLLWNDDRQNKDSSFVETQQQLNSFFYSWAKLDTESLETYENAIEQLIEVLKIMVTSNEEFSPEFSNMK